MSEWLEVAHRQPAGIWVLATLLGLAAAGLVYRILSPLVNLLRDRVVFGQAKVLQVVLTLTAAIAGGWFGFVLTTQGAV